MQLEMQSEFMYPALHVFIHRLQDTNCYCSNFTQVCSKNKSPEARSILSIPSSVECNFGPLITLLNQFTDV